MCNYNAVCPISNGHHCRFNYCCHRRQLVSPCAPRLKCTDECSTLSGSREKYSEAAPWSARTSDSGSPSIAKEAKLTKRNANDTPNSMKKRSSKFKSIVEKMNNINNKKPITQKNSNSNSAQNSRERSVPFEPVIRNSDAIKNATTTLNGKINQTNANYSRISSDQNTFSRKSKKLSPSGSNDNVLIANDKEVQANCMDLEENYSKKRKLTNGQWDYLQNSSDQTEVVNVTRCQDREGIWFKCHVPLRINIPNKLVLQNPNNRNRHKPAAITNRESEIDYVFNDRLRPIDGRYSSMSSGPDRNSSQFCVSLNEFFSPEDKVKTKRKSLDVENKLIRRKFGKKIIKRGRRSIENENLLRASSLSYNNSEDVLKTDMENYYQKIFELNDERLRKFSTDERSDNSKRGFLQNVRSSVKSRTNQRHNLTEQQKIRKTSAKARNGESHKNKVKKIPVQRDLASTEDKEKDLSVGLEPVTSSNTPSTISCCDKAITARRLSFQECEISQNIKKFIADSNLEIKAEIARVREECLEQLKKQNDNETQEAIPLCEMLPDTLLNLVPTITPSSDETSQSQSQPLTQIQQINSTTSAHTSHSSVQISDAVNEVNNAYIAPTETKVSHIIKQTKPYKAPLKKSSNVSIKSSGAKRELKRNSPKSIVNTNEKAVVTSSISPLSQSKEENSSQKIKPSSTSKIENQKKSSKKKESKKIKNSTVSESKTSIESINKSLSLNQSSTKSNHKPKSTSLTKKSKRMKASNKEELKNESTGYEKPENSKSRHIIKETVTPPNSLKSVNSELRGNPLIKCINESCKWSKLRNNFKKNDNNKSASVTLNTDDGTLVAKRKKSKNRKPAGEIEDCEAAFDRSPVILVPYRMSCIFADGEINGEKFINVAQPDPWYAALQPRSDTKTKGKGKNTSEVKMHSKKNLVNISSSAATTNTIVAENSLATVERKNSVETTTLLMPRKLTSDSNIQPTSYSNINSFQDDYDVNSKHQLKKTILYETTTVCNLHNLIEACSRPPANIMGIPRTTDTFLITHNPNPSRHTVSFKDVSCSNLSQRTSSIAANDVGGDQNLSPANSELLNSDISVATTQRQPIKRKMMMPSRAVQHIPVNFYQQTAQKYGFHPMDSFFRQNPMYTMKRHHPIVPRSIGGYNNYASYPYINENFSVASNSLQVHSEPVLVQVPQHQFQHYNDHHCSGLPFGRTYHSINHLNNYQNHFYNLQG